MDPEKLLLTKVETFINEHEMLEREVPVLIGLSGGADSTALLDVLITLGYPCIAAHCNFQLRGDESVRDHEFARMQAQNYGIPFREISFDTRRYASERGISIEMACRELRYEWFEELIQKEGAQAIAVAHHRDDSIETFFLNLLRGTGIAGLSGINAVHGNVVRPFLSASRREIEDYLGVRHIDFITDSSNKEEIYQRNKIRLQLMPLLQSINPAASDSILRTINNLQQVEKVYDDAIHRAELKVVTTREEEVLISIPELLNQPAPRALLFEILKEYEVPSVMIQDIENSLTGISGKQFFAGNYRIVKDRDVLIIGQRDTRDSPEQYFVVPGEKAIHTPMELHFEVMDYFPGFIIPKNKDVACLDADLLNWPLEIRHWQQGDKFVPFGMRGMKKLSDYFSNHKYSMVEKEKAWLLVSGNDIVWLIGERTDNRYRVTSHTKKVLMVTIME